MKAVILAARVGTRLRPLTEDKPKVLVEVDGTPLLEDVFDQLIEVGVSGFVVVVGYLTEGIIERYGDAYRGVPITYAHQREQLGLAHALLQAEPSVEADFALMLGDNVFRANLGEVVEVVEKPDDPPSNLVMTGFYTFTPAIFHTCHLVQPSDRGEYELPDAIDLVIQSGRTIDAVRMEGWRVDVGYPEDREKVEELIGSGQEAEIEM
ncbi:MAG: sugar phosphate nucleotidyltransferase [Halobacteriales archaeon]